MTKFQIVVLLVGSLISTTFSFCTLPEADPVRNINRVRLINNGYEGLLVAVDPRLSESSSIIAGIKDYFNEASRALFFATNNRAFLREITILVPETWTSINASLAKSETLQRAHVLIGQRTREWGDNPYTFMKGGPCGTPGEYIYLTDNYVKNKASSESVFGPIGKTLVHEWGHLRWGLYDEYNWQDNVPNCYLTPGGSVKEVKCAKGLTGQIVYHQRTCRFIPNLNQESEASLMYMHHLRSITKFCNETGPDGIAHDRDAQNPQNRMCNGKSSWEVMNQHQDFRNGANPPVTSEISIMPTFKIVRSGSLRVAMIYDVSGSMTSGPHNRLADLQRAAKRFFLSKTALGAFVGSAEFSFGSHITHNMIRVITDDNRQSLIDQIPQTANGGTCIGCGLKSGLELLKQTEDGSNGGVIIIITDGEENQRPTVREVASKILQSGARVFPLLMLQDFSPDLSRLALCSGGRAFGYSDMGQASDMYDAIQQVMQLAAAENSTVPTMLKSQVIEIESGDDRTLEVKVDSAAAKNFQFVFTNTGCSSTKVTIKFPSGDVAGEDNLSAKEKTFTFEDSPPGIWNIEIKNSALVLPCSTKLTIEMFTLKNSPDVVTLTTTLSTDTADFNSASPPLLSFHGTVKRGNTPIIGAEVEAIIETANNQVIKQRLLDNGAGSDFKKDDGVYSSYFVNFKGDGMYSVKLQLKSNKNSTKLLFKTRSYGAGAPPVNPQGVTETIETEAIEEFERNTVAGTINVQNLGNGNAAEHFPPGRVTDLSVLEVKDGWIVDLSWTAVGAHLDTGKANQYEIYYGKSVNDIRQNCIGTCQVVAPKMIIVGNMSDPKESGEQELFKIDFKSLNLKDDDLLFVGLKVNNNLLGGQGDISNIIDCRNVIGTAVLPPKKGKLSGGAIAGIVIGCVAVVGIIAAVLVVIKKKNQVTSLKVSKIEKKNEKENKKQIERRQAYV